MKPVLSLALVASLLAGCSGGSGELPAKDDAALKNNFNRNLTPEEMAKMGGKPPADAGKPPTGG